MNDKQKILEFVLQRSAPTSRGDIVAALGIPASSAARYLDELQSGGELDRSGQGRSTVYMVDAADAYAYQEKLKGTKRQKVPYDFDRVRRFPVGEFSYFTPAQRSELIEFGQVPEIMTHPEYIESIKRKLLLEASWSSSVLEGNTYSLLDTEELFERNAEMPGARVEETTMLLNHKHAIEYLLGNIDVISVTKMDVLNVHALLSNGLLKTPANSGRLRRTPIGIGQSMYEPLDIPAQISDEFDAVVEIAGKVEDPFDQSMYLLLNMAYLQAFVDVNKRTARMMANVPLLKAGKMPMSFFQMSRKGYECGLLHYYETGDFRRIVKEYMASYRVSAARFKEILENKPSATDLSLRLKFRRQIVESVRAIVKGSDAWDEFLPKDITEQERSFLEDYIAKCVEGISEANAILYGLSANDLNAFLGRSAIPRPKG